MIALILRHLGIDEHRLPWPPDGGHELGQELVAQEAVPVVGDHREIDVGQSAVQLGHERRRQRLGDRAVVAHIELQQLVAVDPEAVLHGGRLLGRGERAQRQLGVLERAEMSCLLVVADHGDEADRGAELEQVAADQGGAAERGLHLLPARGDGRRLRRKADRSAVGPRFA